MGALFAIFLALPLVPYLLFLIVQNYSHIPFFLRFDEWFASLLLHMAVSAAYIQSYPPAQVPAPSLKIVLLFESASSQGLTTEELSRYMDKNELVSSGLTDLINAKLVREQNGVYSLTPVSRNFLYAIKFFRRLLGLQFKGG